MKSRKTTTTNLAAQATAFTNKATKKKAPRVVEALRLGYTDLMPFHFWLDCFEFNNLRNAFEKLEAIEDACWRNWAFHHTRFQNLVAHCELAINGPVGITHQDLLVVSWLAREMLAIEHDACARLDRAMFERDLLADELASCNKYQVENNKNLERAFIYFTTSSAN